MKKQTAVEYLVEQLKERGYAGEFPPHLLFEQALAMEKEQIIDAITYGCSDWGSVKNAEAYYNKNL
jgi:hypothetical protein